LTDPDTPLRLEYGGPVHGMTLVRQSPPAGAASFSATYVGPAGWGFDPAGSEGTARIVNHLLTSGAGPLDRVALARRLDQAGATLTTECAPESGEATIWGPAASWEKLLALLADVVLRPRFDLDDLERVRRQLTERQLREVSQPASRADRELFRSTYPRGHPYRSNGLGSPLSIERISPDRLRRFHREQYTGADALLVVTAPARRASIEAVVRSCFEGLESKQARSLRIPPVRAGRPRTVRVDLKGRTQVEIRIGGNSLSRSDPQYPAAFLANEILGGRAQLSRLFQRIRERGGLVYHASSELEAMRFGGYWSVGAGTGPERTDRVVTALAHEVESMAAREVSATELRVVRESTIGELPLALETTAEAHELAVEVAYHRLPSDYLLQWPAALRAVRPRHVRTAAERAMDSGHATTVIAGPIGSP